jgi:pilus assembly protein CpaF
MAGMELPLRAIRDQTASALDLIVHLSRLRDGSRRVTQISEIVGSESDVVSLSEIYGFDYSAGTTPDGRHLGGLRPTGLRPTFTERLADVGVELPARLLGIEAPVLQRPGARR